MFSDKCKAIPLCLYAVLGFAVTLSSLAGNAAEGADAKERAFLHVGTMHSPPFSIRQSDGSWGGISIDLWRKIADELEVHYQIEERSLSDLISGVASGEVDVAVAALTITESREKLLDFTHPIHSTGLAIAAKPGKSGNVWFSVFQQLFTWQFIQMVGALVLMLLVVGFVIWLVEHKHEHAHEDSHTIRYISEGFWWAAATMTTVGYGDKTPLTRTGRALGVVWMFTALMIVASFIAAFSSVLTVNNLNTNVGGPETLAKGLVATVPGSTSEEYLHHNGMRFKTYKTVSDGLQAVVDGDVKVMVYDAPLMQYLVKKNFSSKLEVSPVTFERQDYGFALPANSELRESINRILVRTVRTEEWVHTLDQYLGK